MIKVLRYQGLRASLLAGLLLAWIGNTPAWAILDSGELKPEQAHNEAVTEIIHRLRRHHYSNLFVDDNLSSRLLDDYIDKLDHGRLFFLQADIDAFQVYRYEMDDALKEGDLTAGYEIFNRYHKRLAERLTALVENLDYTIDNLDFTREENLLLDRSNQAWPKNAAEADELWRQNIKAAVLNLKIAGKDMKAIKELMSKRYSNQLSRSQQLESEDVFQTYVNALTGVFDPHTNYLSPRTAENFNISMSLSLEGIGAVLQTEDEYTKVVRLVVAGPADKQGELQPADRIVAVGQGADGEMVDVIGWRLDEVVELIRGKKGTTVRLEVLPANAKTDDVRSVIEIVRNKVKLEEQSAQKEILEIHYNGELHKLGVIDIPTFYMDFEAARRGDPNYKSTTRDVSRLLTELMAEEVEGIIIDLSGNGGGSLPEANALTSLFIEKGPIVQIRHSNTKVERKHKYVATPYYTGPVAVLIDRLSASASEIFAGAIQDYQRGLIIGSQSFGKGTVQSLTALNHGHLKLTESKFYRISGESTQHRGVVPDIVFPTLYNQQKIGESSLPNALVWDSIAPVKHKTYFDIARVVKDLQTRHDNRVAVDPDFVYLRDQLSYAEETRQIEEVTLNEKARLALREQDKQRQLDMENKRRKAKGMEPLSSLEDKNNSDENTSEISEASTVKAEDDVILTEAGNVLLDAIYNARQLVVHTGGNP
jgi:carboxyl-terminal processing protease